VPVSDTGPNPDPNHPDFDPDHLDSKYDNPDLDPTRLVLILALIMAIFILLSTIP
jgi:hypothetical protein